MLYPLRIHVKPAIAGHRPWLHLGLFFVLMGAIDLNAVLGELANQPVWFKTLILGTLPLQVWLGGRLAGIGVRRQRPSAQDRPPVLLP
jgi:hypothetical protein